MSESQYFQPWQDLAAMQLSGSLEAKVDSQANSSRFQRLFQVAIAISKVSFKGLFCKLKTYTNLT